MERSSEPLPGRSPALAWRKRRLISDSEGDASPHAKNSFCRPPAPVQSPNILQISRSECPPGKVRRRNLIDSTADRYQRCSRNSTSADKKEVSKYDQIILKINQQMSENLGKIRKKYVSSDGSSDSN